MANDLNQAELAALRAGYRRLQGLAGLLDAINVFPVADADTGNNLTASLAPLERDFASATELAEALLWAAQGNSGNIAVGFLQGLLEAPEAPLLARCARGSALARAAVAEPRPGTMLTVLERLVDAGTRLGPGPERFPALAVELGDAVAETTAAMAVLSHCGVVDSGALGLFVFLEEYLGELAGSSARTDLAARFEGRLTLQQAAPDRHADGDCIDAVLRVAPATRDLGDELRALGNSAVIVRAGELYKLHVHAPDRSQVRAALGRLGEVVRFDTSALTPPSATLAPATPTGAFGGRAASGRARVVTDAAGSLSRERAAAIGVELLDSYVHLPMGSGPETAVDPRAVWAALRGGHRVTTAQAPVAQRHARFEALLAEHQRVVYLCVGSAFTGNHAVASDWARRRGVEDRFLVIDSGVASGRLAVVVEALARRAARPGGLDFADEAARLLASADELIFIDSLEYLARSGRLSRASAWFGGLLGWKPVVTPTPQGARRVAMVRTFDEQLDLVRRRLGQVPRGDRLRVLVEYTDNEALVRERVLPALRAIAGEAAIELVPLSLTTAVHTGPGTWAVAFLLHDHDAEATPCA